MVFGEKITISTKGFSDIKNITDKVKSIVSRSGIKDGLVGIFIIDHDNRPRSREVFIQVTGE